MREAVNRERVRNRLSVTLSVYRLISTKADYLTEPELSVVHAALLLQPSRAWRGGGGLRVWREGWGPGWGVSASVVFLHPKLHSLV